ncbi:Type-1 restriction enzyme EcoKI specificity protein [anaerobic digester metagenome]
MESEKHRISISTEPEARALAEGWCSVKIGDCCQVRGGKRLPKGCNYSLKPTSHPYIRVVNFVNRSVDPTDIVYIDEDTFHQISNYIITKRDLYISIAGSIGKVGVIPDELDCANLTENAARIILPGIIDRNYLCLLLNSEICQNQIEHLTISTNQPKLGLYRINEIQIPLPPLAEQRRIVVQLEALLADLERVRGRLEAVAATMQRFRQAVLAAACDGRLTERWRVEQQDNDSIQLARTHSDRIPIQNIPSNWQVVQLSEISGLTSGNAFKKSEYSHAGVKLLQIANVSFGKIIWDDLAYLPRDYLKNFPNLSLNQGDILMALNRPLLGGKLKIGMLNQSDVPAILYQRVGRFDVNNPEFKSYLFVFFKSLYFISQLEKDLQGVDQPFIRKSKLLALYVPLPPLPEQHEIVRRVEALFALADRIEDEVAVALERVEALTAAILTKAFRGELVPTEAELARREGREYEPASALLERVQTDHEATPRPVKSPRKRKEGGAVMLEAGIEDRNSKGSLRC